MKKLILFPAICLVLAACKKDKDEPEAPGVAGYWVGKYSYYNNEYPTEFIAVLFKSDSTLRAYDNSSGDTTLNYKGGGTYRMKGDSVIGQYVLSGAPFNATRLIRAIVNPKFTFMEGETRLSNTVLLGPMYLVKQ